MDNECLAWPLSTWSFTETKSARRAAAAAWGLLCCGGGQQWERCTPTFYRRSGAFTQAVGGPHCRISVEARGCSGGGDSRLATLKLSKGIPSSYL